MIDNGEKNSNTVLLESMSKDNGFSLDDNALVLNALGEIIVSQLMKGEAIRIRNVGVFLIERRKPYFRAEKCLRELVNNHCVNNEEEKIDEIEDFLDDRYCMDEPEILDALTIKDNFSIDKNKSIIDSFYSLLGLWLKEGKSVPFPGIGVFSVGKVQNTGITKEE